MADEQKKIIPIDYTHRDYESIRKDLRGVAERLYPNTFQDFSEASFGALMLDAIAYVGDQLSFYLDYNVNETFLDTSYEYDNVLRHGRALGYKYTGRPSTYGQAALFIKVPASTTGLGPDTNYIPILKQGSRFSSDSGLGFILMENVDFSDPLNMVVVASTNSSTGAPTSFAIKAYGNVVSGVFGREEITVGAYQSFFSAQLGDPNISEVLSVVDAEGNEYFEVDYMAQDIVYKKTPNNNYKNDNVPSVLRPKLVSRKFTVIQDRTRALLQFGSGDSAFADVAAEPQNVAAEIFGKSYVTNTTFDPTQVFKNKNFGVVPQNTTLTVIYRSTNPTNSNISVGSLTTVASANMRFQNEETLTTSKKSDVVASLEVANEVPITGDTSNATTSDIKRRIYDTFPTQNRAVTQADYENIAYRMPAQLGSISRVSVQRDPSSAKRNLNMYIISQNKFKKFTTTNNTIKNNLKIWLNNYRMLNDTVDILDAFIINLGVEFIITPAIGEDKYLILDRAIVAIQAYFQNEYYIGESLSISDIYSELKKVTGVLDVTNVKIVNKTGTQYASTQFEVDSNISPDGSSLICPNNCVFEIKFGATDIRGKVR